MASELDGKQIVITGGAGALGTEVTRAFLDAGARVHIPLFEAEVPPAFPFADDDRVQLRCGVDLSSEEAVVDYFESVGVLWASVHLAGGFAMAPIAETSLADFRKMADMNGVTCFLSCREAVRAIRKGGGGGRIVNVSARPVVQPVGGLTAYLASKAMVAAITGGLAAELSSEEILVNAVLPSVIDTPANREGMPDADHRSWPKPAEIARAILFLASPANALTSGDLLPVYGRA